MPNRQTLRLQSIYNYNTNIPFFTGFFAGTLNISSAHEQACSCAEDMFKVPAKNPVKNGILVL